jgi:hypothetical protein
LHERGVGTWATVPAELCTEAAPVAPAVPELASATPRHAFLFDCWQNFRAEFGGGFGGAPRRGRHAFLFDCWQNFSFGNSSKPDLTRSLAPGQVGFGGISEASPRSLRNGLPVEPYGQSSCAEKKRINQYTYPYLC